MRRLRSSHQDDRGFIERKDLLDQLGGTWLAKKAIPIASSSSVMAMRPANAFKKLGRLLRMTLVTLFYFWHSCANTVLRHWSLWVGYEPCTRSKSNLGGTLASRLSAISFIISSEERPAPPPERGWIDCSVSIICRATFWFVVISAFSCRPYRSGLICSKVESMWCM